MYCRQDLEKKLFQSPTVSLTRSPRHISITIASIVFFLVGMVGIFFSLHFSLTSLSILTSPVPSPFFMHSPHDIAFALLTIGVFDLIISCLDVIAGYWLWYSLQKEES